MQKNPTKGIDRSTIFEVKLLLREVISKRCAGPSLPDNKATHRQGRGLSHCHLSFYNLQMTDTYIPPGNQMSQVVFTDLEL